MNVLLGRLLSKLSEEALAPPDKVCAVKRERLKVVPCLSGSQSTERKEHQKFKQIGFEHNRKKVSENFKKELKSEL